MWCGCIPVLCLYMCLPLHGKKEGKIGWYKNPADVEGSGREPFQFSFGCLLTLP